MGDCVDTEQRIANNGRAKVKRRLLVASLLLCAVLIANCSPRPDIAPSSTSTVSPASSPEVENPAITAVQLYLKEKLEIEVNVLFGDSTLNRESREAHVQSFDEIAAWLNGTWSCQSLGEGKWMVRTVYPCKGTEKSKCWHFHEDFGVIQEVPNETAPR